VEVLREETEFIKSVIRPAVGRCYPSKANHENMSLYDLIAFAVLAHRRFDGIYKRVHRVMVEKLELFPYVRYNKVKGVESLHRYEELLFECLEFFKREGLMVMDSPPGDQETGQAWTTQETGIL